MSPFRNHFSLTVLSFTQSSQLLQNTSSGRFGGSLRTIALMRWPVDAGLGLRDLDGVDMWSASDSVESPNEGGTKWRISTCCQSLRNAPISIILSCNQRSNQAKTRPKSIQTISRRSFPWQNHPLWKQRSRDGTSNKTDLVTQRQIKENKIRDIRQVNVHYNPR